MMIPLDIFRKTGVAALLAAVAVSFLFVISDFTGFADRNPNVLVDDALGNIAVTMVHHGRNAFLASPLQGSSDSVRSTSQFNYGPLPFVIEAGFDWLFGTSLAVHRAVHPVMLAVAAAIALLALRRASLIAGGLFAALTVFMLWPAHWVMVRPDAVTAVTGIAAVAAAGWAIGSGRAVAWFVTGLLAALALTSHQIIWFLAPWSIVLLVAAEIVLERRDRAAGWSWRRAGLRFAGLAAGGLLGALSYLVAIDFRVPEVMALWQSYGDVIAGREIGYWDTVHRHFTAAARAVPPWLIFATLAGAAAALLYASWRGGPGVRRRAWALLLPGLSASVGFLASLGIYANFAMGYALFTQLSVIWVLAALAGGAVIWLRRLSADTVRRAETASMVCLAAAMVVGLAGGLHRNRIGAYTGNVSFTAYQDRVFELIPDGASAWGSAMFGLDSGNRTQLVQWGDALPFAWRYKPAYRWMIAPDYLVANELIPYLLFSVLKYRKTFADNRRQGRDTPPLKMALMETRNTLPGTDYHPVSIVRALPYGTTVVFRRGEAAQPVAVAESVYRSSAWRRQVGAPVRVGFAEDDPAGVTLHYYNHVVGAAANRTLSATLPKGTYLITVDLERARQGAPGILIATATRALDLHLGNNSGNANIFPYFGYHERGYVLVDHPGGRLFLSRFDGDPSASMRIVSVRPVIAVGTAPVMTAKRARALPAAAWRPYRDAVTIAPGSGSRRRVSGVSQSDTAQVITGPITFAPNLDVEVRVDATAEGGAIGVGALNETRSKWLAPLAPAGTPLRFSTPLDKGAKVFLFISSTGTDAPRPLTIDLGPGRILEAARPHRFRLYADQLTACAWPAFRPKVAEACR